MRRVFLSACFAFFLASGVMAAVIHVPADQPTIQAGIDAAVNGDTVRVGAWMGAGKRDTVRVTGASMGEGNRDIDFRGKRILVEGQGPYASYIHCGGMPNDHHVGFLFHSGENDSSVLRGFTIEAAWVESPADSGALMIVNSSPRIVNCRIVFNHASGIHATGAPTFDSCIIYDNDGWGIAWPFYPSNTGGLNLKNCTIVQNGMGGVTVPFPSAGVMVCNNTVAYNTGDGIRLNGEPPAKATAGELIDTNAYFQNNLVAFNSGSGFLRACCWYPGIHLWCNDVFGNTSDWSGILGPGVDTVNNMNVDPLLCDNGLWVRSGSPCFPENNMCSDLIGAVSPSCEHCCTSYAGNIDCDDQGLVDISDLTRLIDYQYISFRPICCPASAELDEDPGTDISDLTFLIDYLYTPFTADVQFRSPLPLCH